VKINIPSRNFSGYCHLDMLHPEVPVGTIIHFSTDDKSSVKLYKNADANDEDGLELGTDVTATVLFYDPTDENKWDLYVSINDGPNKGKKGWMLSFLEKTSDGQLMNQFDQAAIENKEHHP
jgi:hypothetical protein